MIPQKIQALFDFIEYLDKNKKVYVERYVPLCYEIKALYNRTEKLNPRNNYKDKQEYDRIHAQIVEKLQPITQDICNPIKDKLRELNIWDGDDTFNSIWNNNFPAIIDFKEFKIEDVDIIVIKESKRKYLCFRQETKTDFLCLIVVFHNLNKISKELFDFFKDTEENEFESIESQTISVSSPSEAFKIFKENPSENIKFTIPPESFSNNPITNETKASTTNIKNEIIMGNKFNIGDIPNNNGQINIGYKNKSTMNDKDDLTKKSFNWQKTGIIIATILAIVTIALMIILGN